jgi:hypothetical protein
MSLVNYEQLKQHFEGVKPIRGTTIKPFQQRRRKWEHMVMQKNGDIQLICHNTPVLTIHPDDSFSVCHGGWATPTTSSFIHYVVMVMGWREPLAGAFKYKNQLWLSQWWNGRAVYIDGRKDHWSRMPITKEPIRYTYNPEIKLYSPDTNPKVTKTRPRVDRNKWKQAQQQCKDFLDWFNAFGKLLDGVVVEDTVSLTYATRVCMQYPFVLSKPEHWATKEAKDILTAIFTQGGDEDYLQVVKNLVQMSHNVEFNYKQIKTKVHNILKHMFGVYYGVDVEVEYALNRKTKW